jgi:DNA-binding NtrC family response regulator
MKASYATKWNQSRTAEVLRLKRDKLRYRMKLYGLETPRSSNTSSDRAA